MRQGRKAQFQHSHQKNKWQDKIGIRSRRYAGGGKKVDSGIQKSKKSAERNIGLQRENTQNVCENQKGKNAKPGRRQKEKPVRIVDADQIKLSVDHFFPKGLLNRWISRIPDPRMRDMCTYDLKHLTWMGLLMFLFRLGSRRQLLKERETEVFLQNLLGLSGTDEKQVAHPDTLNYLLELVNPDELEAVKVKMVKQLIKDRRLDAFRLRGEFRIAIDGTGVFSFSGQHCEHCLKTEHSGGAVTWSHKVLEAKLIAENGFALSVCSEAIENENGLYDKQDCELKAFYRLEKHLKTFFPRTPVCLLLDGLYACREVFDICRRNNWSYIIVFKEGSIPTLFKEAVAKKKRYPQNSLEITGDKNITEKLSWVHNLEYGEHAVHVIFCEERMAEKGKDSAPKWVWITDHRPSIENIEELVNKGGRQRWKIENQGFKEQKRHDFELEHLYGQAPNAWKNYYQLLQIAHIITQLIIYGDLCEKLQERSLERQNSIILPFNEYYHSIRNFVRRLAESFRNRLFSDLAYKLSGNIQIRFDPG